MPSPQRDPQPQDLTTMHVREACEGQAQSVDWMVKRFTPLLLAQARYRLRGRMATICDPHDVVNDVWLATLPKLHVIEPRGGRYTPVLVSYLAKTVLNRVNTLVAKYLRGKPKSTADNIEALPAETVTIVSRAVRNERKDILLTTIENLADADREILILGAIEQRAHQEIAEALGIQPGTARVRLHRAIQKLRDALPGSIFDELVPTES